MLGADRTNKMDEITGSPPTERRHVPALPPVGTRIHLPLPGARPGPSSSRIRIPLRSYKPVDSNVEAPISRLNVPVQKVVLVRPRTSPAQTNLEDYKSLRDGEEIPEDEAVCKLCFGIVKDQGNLLKTECQCKISLLHERCALAFSGSKNCEVCEKEVKNLPVTLIWMPSSAAAINSVKSQKKSFFSRFKRLWLPIQAMQRRLSKSVRAAH